jgi:hypothetical protein
MGKAQHLTNQGTWEQMAERCWGGKHQKLIQGMFPELKDVKFLDQKVSTCALYNG